MIPVKLRLWLLAFASGVLMSLPFLVPACGWVALFGFVPLLKMEALAAETGQRHLWLRTYSCFLVWNALTTFWVCNATFAGGVFAIVANSAWMLLVFALFRLSRKAFKGVVPYIFLVLTWIAWERFYLTWSQISWPWLVLGNAFARTLPLAQWYEYTGHLGGSLWVWLCNLTLFGMLQSFSSGRWKSFNPKAKTAALGVSLLVFIFPATVSLVIYSTYNEVEDPLEVMVVQPNFEPFQKRTAFTRQQQDEVLLDAIMLTLKDRSGDMEASPILIVAPETFTNNVVINDVDANESVLKYSRCIRAYPNANLLVGASSRTYYFDKERPDYTARHLRDGSWVDSHNSALMIDGWSPTQVFHKSKLVVGTELTPYPALFCKIDDWLGGVMGRCVGQDEVSTLEAHEYTPEGKLCRSIPIGSVICYESVYGEYCTEYIKKGAKALAVITNDAWWGNTPGYRQHCSYASLRAIETRRDVVRCGNTGISGIIDQRGRLTERTNWWEPAILRSHINLNDRETFFVRNGDFIGRFSFFLFLLMLLGLIVRLISPLARK